jgi:TDG/mug DNA glycosylase family protein
MNLAQRVQTSDGVRLRGLPPVADARSVVLVLGSFPSVQSLHRRQYYANPRNQFWQIIQSLFGISSALSYEDRLKALLDRRVALWDVIGECRREGSSDSAIADAVVNPLPQFLTEHRAIRFVALNGQKAEQVARRLIAGLFALDSVVAQPLPSTSPANTMPFEEKLRRWQPLKRHLAAAP